MYEYSPTSMPSAPPLSTTQDLQPKNRLIPVRKNLVSRERRSGNASGNKARSSSRIYRESSRRTVVPLDGVTGWGFSRGRHDGVDNIGRSGYVLHSAWD